MPTFPNPLVIRRQGLVLRQWTEQDAPVLREVCGDPDVCRFTSVPWVYSDEATRAWVQCVAERQRTGEALALAIVAGDGTEAALGYWLVPGARGNGYATQAAEALCGWAFEQLGLQRIELAILPDNEASRRLAERLGANCEGVRRDSHEAEGRRWDMEIYAL